MKQYFFLRLIPPRPTFAQDMTGDERAVMVEHVAYFAEQFTAGHVLIYGPVQAQSGGFGMGVLEVDSEADAHAIMAADPTIRAGLNRYELSPMRIGNARGLQPR